MSKRLQVTVSDRVGGIIEAIAEEENTSVSKVAAALVEEGLRVRGALSKESRINEVLPPSAERDSVVRRDSLEAWAQERGLSVQTTENTAAQDLGDDDMKLLKKLKMLKELGLL